MVNSARPSQSDVESVLGTYEDLEGFADLVAHRVVELLRNDQATVSVRPLDALQVGKLIGRSRDWVYAHRHELGVLPAAGRRPRLMFDAAKVAEFVTARDGSVRSVPRDPAPTLTSRHARRARMSSGGNLLPIRGVEEGEKRAA